MNLFFKWFFFLKNFSWSLVSIVDPDLYILILLQELTMAVGILQNLVDKEEMENFLLMEILKENHLPEVPLKKLK